MCKGLINRVIHLEKVSDDDSDVWWLHNKGKKCLWHLGTKTNNEILLYRFKFYQIKNFYELHGQTLILELTKMEYSQVNLIHGYSNKLI